MKRSVISFAIAVITAVAMFAGCVPKAAQTDEPASPVPTAEQVSPTAGDVAEEPVFTLTDLPDDVELPDFYTEVIIPGVENRVFAFTDTTGSVQLRVYGVRSIFSASGEPEDVSAGFFPAQITQTGNDE